MGKKILGAVASGLALALVAGGQPAVAEPVALVQPDPLLAFLPDLAEVDWAAVNRKRDERRSARVQVAKDGKPLAYNEREAVGTRGGNDTVALAEAVAGFGTRTGLNPRVTLTGDLAKDVETPSVPAFAEDNGTLALASDPGVSADRPAVRTTGTIGDGPHGSAGDRTGDFDFYRLTGNGRATIETRTPTSTLDSVVALYDATGKLLVANDNVGGGTDSRLQTTLQPGTDYYVMVSGAGAAAIPPDPTKPGTGVGSEGTYDLTLTVGETNGDKDFYAVVLRAGDVLGGSVAGSAARLAVHDSAGREVFGSTQDFTSIYPAQSPLPGGGNAVVDFVAPRDGRYTVSVEHGEGPYTVTTEAYRPGTETDARNTVQTLFLDFDGARVNTAIFGGPGVRQLSPLSAFIAKWGLTAKDENAVIDAVVEEVRESIEKDLAVKGTNHRFAVRILNSRDHADPFGQPNVSRVVVGGTIAESGVNTIGIAQSIDPGNFAHEETALVLLDRMSAPAGPSASLNTYLTAASNRTGFVGQAIGNVVAHEIGHYAGSWHVDQFNDIPSLMDQGGNPKVMFAVGPDGVGGTADDPDVDFTEDHLNPAEGFSGAEDTLNRTAWAFVRGNG